MLNQVKDIQKFYQENYMTLLTINQTIKEEVIRCFQEGSLISRVMSSL